MGEPRHETLLLLRGELLQPFLLLPQCALALALRLACALMVDVNTVKFESLTTNLPSSLFSAGACSRCSKQCHHLIFTVTCKSFLARVLKQCCKDFYHLEHIQSLGEQERVKDLESATARHPKECEI